MRWLNGTLPCPYWVQTLSILRRGPAITAAQAGVALAVEAYLPASRILLLRRGLRDRTVQNPVLRPMPSGHKSFKPLRWDRTGLLWFDRMAEGLAVKVTPL
jgi:hypothetical protein